MFDTGTMSQDDALTLEHLEKPSPAKQVVGLVTSAVDQLRVFAKGNPFEASADVLIHRFMEFRDQFRGEADRMAQAIRGLVNEVHINADFCWLRSAINAALLRLPEFATRWAGLSEFRSCLRDLSAVGELVLDGLRAAGARWSCSAIVWFCVVE